MSSSNCDSRQRILERARHEDLKKRLPIPLCGDLVPPLEEEVKYDQAMVDPPLTDGAIRDALFNWPKPLLPKNKIPLLKIKA